MVQFHTTLAALIDKYNLTQEQVAIAIGASRSSVSHWLRGQGLPRKDKIRKLANLFNVSESHLDGNVLKNKNTSSFSCKLVEMMFHRGINQKKLAEHLGIAEASVSKWINKGTEPRYKTLLRLARLLDVPADMLMDENRDLPKFGGKLLSDLAAESEKAQKPLAAFKPKRAVIKAQSDKTPKDIAGIQKQIDKDEVKAIIDVRKTTKTPRSWSSISESRRKMSTNEPRRRLKD